MEDLTVVLAVVEKEGAVVPVEAWVARIDK